MFLGGVGYPRSWTYFEKKTRFSLVRGKTILLLIEISLWQLVLMDTSASPKCNAIAGHTKSIYLSL